GWLHLCSVIFKICCQRFFVLSRARVMSASLFRRDIVLTSAASAIIVFVISSVCSTVARYSAAAASTRGFLPITAVWLATDDRISLALLDTSSPMPARSDIFAMFLKGSVIGGSTCISLTKIL